MAEGTSQPRLADTGRTDDDQMMMVADPLAAGELVEQSAVEAAGRMQVDILDDGGLTQPGLAQAAGEALVLPAGRLAIDQQAEPVLARQLGGIRRVLHLDEGVGHGSKAERAQALDGGVDQHLFSFQW